MILSRTIYFSMLLLAGCAGTTGTDAQSSSLGTAPSVVSAAHPAQTFRGFGMSLAWEANLVYGSHYVTSVLPASEQDNFMKLLYGNPADSVVPYAGSTAVHPLGLNVARYNIGGGEDPARLAASTPTSGPDSKLVADGRAIMDGFQPTPLGAFEWDVDAPQIKMLQQAKALGANVFQAFSNSPPYWMTVSGTVTGNTLPYTDNLAPTMYGQFVNYLVTVVQHFELVEGISFESVEAFNEPDVNWQAQPGPNGNQEGCFAKAETQNIVLPQLARALKVAGLRTIVAGTDATSIDDMTGFLENDFDPNALAALGQIDTHAYSGTNRAALKSIATKLAKPVWMSEVGCCLEWVATPTPPATSLFAALWMADSARMDLRDMGASVWVFWQPNWGVVSLDAKGSHPQKQFFAIAQYSSFIRPGFQIVSAGDADNTLAAYDPVGHRLVLVAVNWAASPQAGDHTTSNRYDLSGFRNLPAKATVYRTSDSENIQASSLALGKSNVLADASIPDGTITTYVLDGVTLASTPTPSPVVTPTSSASGALAGTHQIVTYGNAYCLDVNHDSTASNAAIIDFACSNALNSQFELVADPSGAYSIHTLNGGDLCLNVSEASLEPGDGATLGGAGNLIQYPCGSGTTPANSLFRVVDQKDGYVQLVVSNSGLCLEEGSNTIRQDTCDPTGANHAQLFSLTGYGSYFASQRYAILFAGTQSGLNVRGDSTASIAPIVPYPFSSANADSMFALDSQPDGTFALRTLNGGDLCLNISCDALTSGDGKTYSAPGNLIQYDCGDDAAPQNSRFTISELGDGTVQLVAVHSGLCLEYDAGTSTTIFQTTCAVANPHQHFTIQSVDNLY